MTFLKLVADTTTKPNANTDLNPNPNPYFFCHSGRTAKANDVPHLRMSVISYRFWTPVAADRTMHTSQNTSSMLA